MAEYFPIDVSSIGSYSGSFSGSFQGNGSRLTGITASFFSGSVTSASYAATASYLLGSIASASYALTASYATQAGNASTIDINTFGSPVDSYLLMSNVAGTTGVAIGGDADLRYNSSTNVLTVPNISATTLTGSLLGTASNALTASYVNPLVQNVIITGSITTGVANSVNGTVTINRSGGNVGLIIRGSDGNIVGAGNAPVYEPYNYADASHNFNIGHGSAGNYNWFVGTNATLNLNTQLMRLTRGGNLLIGTTTDSARLQVRGSGTTSATTALRVENTNASASLVVLDNSNVGIGVTNPAYALQVSRSIWIQPTNNSDDGLYISNQGFLVFRDTANSITTRLRGITGSYQFQDAAYNIKSLISTNNNITYFNNGGGNVGIGLTSPASTLHISGASNSGLLKIDSPTVSNIIYASGSGTVGIGNTGVLNTALAVTANGTGGGNFIVQGYDSGAVNRFLVTATGRLQMTGTTDTGTSGTDERVRLTNTFNPTSGTREHMGIYLVQAISQSGGANGITRGLYIQPTLTAATDFRAIENSIGNNLLNSTSGNTYVGLSTNSGTARFQVKGSGATSSTTTFRTENTNASASLEVYDNNSKIDIYRGANGTTGYDGIFVYGPFTTQFGANTSNKGIITFLQQELSSSVYSGIQASHINYGNVRAGVYFVGANSIRFVAGSTVSPNDKNMFFSSNGNFTVGGLTDAGFRLDVSGSSRFTDHMILTGSQTIRHSFGTTYYDSGGYGGGRIYGTYNYLNGEIYILPSGSNNSNFFFSPNNGMSIGGLTIGGTTGSPPAYGLAVSGSIGIGTRVPTTQLDVRGNGRFTNGLTVTGSLIVSGSVNGIDTVYGTLTTNSTNKVDWQNGVLATSTGNNSVDWENRALPTVNGTTAFEYATTADDYASTNLYLTQLNPAQIQRNLTENILYSGHIIEGTIDASVSPYDIMYLDTDGIWYPLKNLPTVSTKMLGIEVAGNILLEGNMTVSDDGSAGTYVVSADHGLPVYLSGTTGVLTTVQPTNDVIRVVGHIYYQNPVSTNVWLMKFRPSNDWTQI